MFFEGVFKALVFFGSLLVAVVMSAVIVAAVYANRGALPVVGAVFGALLLFGLFWPV